MGIITETAKPDLHHCPRCGFLIVAGDATSSVAHGYVRISNTEIERTFGALTAMSQMALPHDKAENKVAILLRKYFELPMQILEQRKKSMFLRVTPPGAMDITMRINEMRQLEMADIMNDTQDIPAIPDRLKIVASDFPTKGERTALSKIKFDLAGYVFDLHDDIE